MDNRIWLRLDSLNIHATMGNVQKRSTVDAQNMNWKTALHNASRRLCCNTAEGLFVQDLNSNNKDVKEEASTHWDAKEMKRCSVQEADLNIQDRSGNTPAHLAIMNKRPSALKNLLGHGVKINLQNYEGLTPLHVACLGHDINIEVIELLLENNAAINMRDNMRKTALHDASCAGAVEVVKRLLARGANVNAQDRMGMTPSHMASTNRSTSVLKVLLEHGAKVNLRNSEGHTPLHVACLAVKVDNLQVIDLLLNHADDIDAKSNVGNTPLHLAVLQPNRVFEKLLNRGARVDEKNNEGETPYDLCFTKAKYVDGRKMIALEKHILKLKTAGIHVDVHLKTDLDIAYEDTKQLYVEELEKMRLVKINNLFSLDSVFFPSKILGYLRNSKSMEKLQNEIYSVHLRKEFPLYKQLLKISFEKAKPRVCLLEEAFSSFNSEKRKLIWSKKLPDLVKFKILDYLSNEDLKKLIESG